MEKIFKFLTLILLCPSMLLGNQNELLTDSLNTPQKVGVINYNFTRLWSSKLDLRPGNIIPKSNSVFTVGNNNFWFANGYFRKMTIGDMDLSQGILNISAPVDHILFHESDEGTDAKTWIIKADGARYELITANDAFSSFAAVMQALRSGVSIVRVTFPNGNIGIGTSNPLKKLEVNGGDLYINKTSSKIILKSPDGSCSECGVDNSDNFSCSSISCP